jgi:hypothetical protein
LPAKADELQFVPAVVNTPAATVIRNALSRWQGLGRIGLDNTTVERTIRPIKLGRKNALFAASDGGAEHWAVVASLIETCKINGVDPLTDLTDVLTKIVNGHPNRDIDQLLPWAYCTQPRQWPETGAYIVRVVGQRPGVPHEMAARGQAGPAFGCDFSPNSCGADRRMRPMVRWPK